MSRIKKALSFVTPALTAAVIAVTAQGQDRPDAEGLRTSLTEMLSLVTLGSVSVPNQSVQIQQSGSEFGVRMPLAGFVAPANASADAIARPDGSGGWDVTSMAFPSTGAIGKSIDQVVSYTIGQQAIHGRLAPKQTAPSTLAADLRSITLLSAGGLNDSNHTIERVILGGHLTETPTGRLDLAAENAVGRLERQSDQPGRTGNEQLYTATEGTFCGLRPRPRARSSADGCRAVVYDNRESPGAANRPVID